MRYNPKTVPLNINELPLYLQQELLDIAMSIVKDGAYTDSQLLAKGSFINTKGKAEGLRVWDSTTKRPLWASGKSPTDSWVDGSGNVAYVPI